MMRLDERRARLRRKMMHRITRSMTSTQREKWLDEFGPQVQEAITAVLFEDFLDELGDKVDGQREVSPTA